MGTMNVDVLIHSATIATCASAGQAKRGAAMREIGAIEHGAIAIKDGIIIEVGASLALRERYRADVEIDAAGRAICPGLIDPHTHVVYAGHRAADFEMKLNGASYLDILAAGGGVIGTMRAVRQASLDSLVAQSGARLAMMLAHGTTTAESKTGYGLNISGELKQLHAMQKLALTQPLELVPTFLGAHATPPEYFGDVDAYTHHVIDEMLPAVREWHAGSVFKHQRLAADVLCESQAFDLPHARDVLSSAYRLGMAVTAHVDQHSALGGLEMALELGARSVDLLDVTGPDALTRLAATASIPVVAPTATFNLGSMQFANARGMIDAGCALALTTDQNPGSAPCPSLQLVMAIACRYQQLTPAEALNACTINAAHALGMGDRIGSLEPGKQADVLLLNAPDTRHLAYQFGGNVVQAVFKRGQLVAGHV